MRTAEVDLAKELLEKYMKALRAWRALREHAGVVKIGFGAAILGLEGTAHAIELTADDRDYNVLMKYMRDMALRQVAGIADELKTMGVDVNA